MTLLVASDLHLGAGASLGDRLADQRSSWTRVCTTAAEMGATVLHAGDVFHSRKASPSEMRAYQAGLDILRDGQCELIVALGNHDRADMDSPTSVEAASAGYEVTVCREPQVLETADGVVGFLPWMPPRMSAKQTEEALMIVAESQAEQGARLLIAHWAIAGGSLPNGLPLLELAEPMLDPYRLAELFGLTFAGHIHLRQEIVPSVWHVGALSRSNFGERGVETGAWQLAKNHEPYWFEVPDRAFVSIVADARGSSRPTDAILEEVDAWPIRDAIVRVVYHVTADQVVEQGEILAVLGAGGAHHVDALTPIIERAQSTRSEGVTEALDPREAWDAWQDAQLDLAAEETLSAVRESAHERIGAAT